jgi:hypothetical protein
MGFTGGCLLGALANNRELREMTHDYKHEVRDYNDGQIHGWNGGECPVHPKTVVEVWFRSKDSDIWQAGGLGWEHTGEYDDIIAFRVVKPYVEPKVIWVNEYQSVLSAWPTEDTAIAAAKRWVTPRTTRIAVKYVEAVNEKDAPHD